MNKINLLKIYKTFYKIRHTELEISKRYKENKMRCPTHLSVGQELVPAVLSIFFKKNDYAISTHRGHAHYLAKGGSLNKMIAEIYGKAAGTSKGKGGSMHLIDLSKNFMGTSAIVANSIPIGTGLGLSSSIIGKKNISYIFFGDGATEEGVFYETINFSAIKKIPCLYICENNFYSVYSPLNVRQPKKREIYELSKAIGVESEICDGYDVNQIYKKINKALKYIKKYSKPYFLEFKSYRWLEHCGPNNDDHLQYRSYKEYINWKKRDQMITIRKKLLKFYNETYLKKIEHNIFNEIEKAFMFAEKSSFPKANQAYKGLYAKK